MVLQAEGAKRRFIYAEPRSGLLEVGVRQGTVLFDGTRQGRRYQGRAYVFSWACGPIPYEVNGDVSTNEQRVDLYGQEPLIDPDCNVVDHRPDHLVFSYMEN
jgi:hypothetical protein